MKFRSILTKALLVSALAISQNLFFVSAQNQAKAQSSQRPYVVLVNGYQDCCIWNPDSGSIYMQSVFSQLQRRGADFRLVPWDRFGDRRRQKSSVSNDSQFLQEAADFLNQLDPSRPLILVGHSYGGDSLLSLAPRINRSIEFLGVIDPVAAGGLREPVTRRGVPSNVRYFFNRWQRNGLNGQNVVPFDSRLINGSISGCQANVCDQQEQNLARREDNSEIRVACERHEVTCPGYQPWPGGSNGTKAKRLAHNDMPLDDYLKRQMANAINTLMISNSSPYVFNADYYLATYSDLRNAFGTNRVRAETHWVSRGILEGRQGSPGFGPKCYLDRYPDLQKAFGSTNYSRALTHYLNNGMNEGRSGRC
jgi:pimeloyl-ACP methyl ester carboxylesterase